MRPLDDAPNRQCVPDRCVPSPDLLTRNMDHIKYAQSPRYVYDPKKTCGDGTYSEAYTIEGLDAIYLVWKITSRGILSIFII